MERHVRRPRLRLDRTAIALAAVLAVALVLRLWGIRHGLPFSYNIDEEGHFVPVAIGFFGHGFDPRYFLNPPGYTELLHVVYAVWFGGREEVAKAYVEHPSEVFLIARVTCALLGVAAVWLLHVVGAKLFDRRVGLLAAALGAVAFLPVFYSHLALNDVPALLPLTLALVATALVLRDDRGRLWPVVLGGVAVGLAAGTKYTAGIVVLPLLTAVALKAMEDRRSLVRALIVPLVALGAAGAVGFFVANPHALLSFSDFRAGIARQRELAGGDELAKLGLTQDNGVLYYLWTFTWGLGWIPSIAALIGAVRLAVRDPRLALVLLPMPVVYLLYMGTQNRFFGRWALPIFPIAMLLAAYAAAGVVTWIARRRPNLAIPAAVVLGVALLGQGLLHSVHVDRVLSREDTRGDAHDWMVENIPAGARVMMEPIVPARWHEDPNRADPATPTGERWELWDTTRADVDDFGRPLPDGRPSRYVKVDKYVRTLRPELIDRYEQQGYCWVVIGSHQRDRGYAEPETVPHAIDYYEALAERGEEVYRVSPYREGADPPRFNFDWAFDYYPLAYERPGPEIMIYRLPGGRCAA